MHIPVLLKEAIEILDPKPGEFFIDGTVGSGGHSAEILRRISPDGILLGIDWDKSQLKIVQQKISAISKSEFLISKTILVHGNYANLPEILSAQSGSASGGKKKKLGRADGLLLDLGFSSNQLESERGFSFLRNEKLDMRYNHESNMTAAEVVNQFREEELANLFWEYSGERFSRQIAKKIVLERKNRPIKTTFDLVEIIKRSVPRNYERGRINPATRVFQALRIYVNDELGNLEKLLNNLEKIVKTKGRIAIISFHSLEDRLVKNCFRQLQKEGKALILTKKPITATRDEVERNPRSRSAKLRGIQLMS